MAQHTLVIVSLCTICLDIEFEERKKYKNNKLSNCDNM